MCIGYLLPLKILWTKPPGFSALSRRPSGPRACQTYTYTSSVYYAKRMCLKCRASGSRNLVFLAIKCRKTWQMFQPRKYLFSFAFSGKEAFFRKTCVSPKSWKNIWAASAERVWPSFLSGRRLRTSPSKICLRVSKACALRARRVKTNGKLLG